jgi:hypothetical protein
MAANGVKIRHRDYDRFTIKWRRCRDVAAGQDAIHSGYTLYLPLLAEEEIPEYTKRVRRTPFYNASWANNGGFCWHDVSQTAASRCSRKN